MAHNPVVKSLTEKVPLLLAENERLLNEQEKLVLRYDKLRDENLRLKNDIDTLQKRIGVLELQDGITGGGQNTKQAKARINRLMREIDRCIALINK